MSRTRAAVVGFVRANTAASRVIERRLPQARTNPRTRYAERVAAAMAAFEAPGLVVDVGGGKACPFAALRRPGSGARIVAVDVSDEELRHNADVDETIVADIVRELPFRAGEARLVVSSSVLEHLPDTRSFIANCRTVLEEEGLTIHLFPGRWAPFAMLNRVLPRGVSRRLLHSLMPGSEGIQGFPAYYDECSAPAMRRLLEREGFHLLELQAGYYQADYFAFFLPLYVLSALYELLLYAFGLEALAANVLVVARKPRAEGSTATRGASATMREPSTESS